jgi:hypothetical protein
MPYKGEFRILHDGNAFWVYHLADTGGGVTESRDVMNYDYFPPVQTDESCFYYAFCETCRYHSINRKTDLQ